MGSLLDSQDAIIALHFFPVALFAFDDSDGAAGQDTSGKNGFVHEHQNIHRVAVSGFGGRDESEAVGKGHSAGQDFREFENTLFDIESELVAAAFWSFDDHAQQLLIVRVHGGKAGRVS
jgi:hypothetical protein